jgi:hypothetical protein
MNLIERNEILPIGEYERIREQFRARVIQEKKARRLHVSDIMSATFENRDTVLMQIQEMLRTERITSESGILHEIETYNDLIPRSNEVSISFFIEISDKETRDKALADLFGLEEHIALDVDGVAYPALTKKREDDVRKTTAVHYFKFALSDDATKAIAARKARVALVVSHPAYAVRAELPAQNLASLAQDFAG